ncbi:MAG: ribonuclease III [Candidatus Nealsonbacteria bacterium]|nr:ribonuclease III [Candidatus Nealsonbacteria bacterium]
MKDFSNLEERIGINFKNRDLLAQALCHRSYLNENPNFYLGHNERLEFLGDAVLELVVTESLYIQYPKKTEGELTSWRAALVNTKILFEVSKKLGLSEFLLLSKGESKSAGRTKQSILANTFEALIGAIYLDGGYDLCKKFTESHLMPRLTEIIKLGLFKDAKSKLQEESQSRESITPCYKVLEEWGPDHKKTFRVGVFIGDDLIAEGKGLSKQEGEEEAAKNALIVKRWHNNN